VGATAVAANEDNRAVPSRYPIIHLFSAQTDFDTGPLVPVLREQAVLRRAAAEVFEHVDAVGARYGIAPLGPALRGLEPPDPGWLAAGPPGTLHLAAFGASMAVHRALCAVGLAPARVLGVGFGEIAAAAAAGVFGLAEGAQIACRLGRVLPRGGGGLIRVAAGETQARALIAALANPRLVLARVAAADESVLSGPLAALDEVELLAAHRGLPTRRLELPFPPHHPELATEARALRVSLRDIRVMRPLVPVYSAVRIAAYESEQAVIEGLADCLTRPAFVPPTLHRVTDGAPALLLQADTGRELSAAAQRTLAVAEADDPHRDVRSVVQAPIADPAFPWAEPERLMVYALRAQSGIRW
jgi:[acyl-carrier-protein] S-malonyltransferase